jgi:hypothetical protein
MHVRLFGSQRHDYPGCERMSAPFMSVGRLEEDSTIYLMCLTMCNVHVLVPLYFAQQLLAREFIASEVQAEDCSAQALSQKLSVDSIDECYALLAKRIVLHKTSVGIQNHVLRLVQTVLRPQRQPSNVDSTIIATTCGAIGLMMVHKAGIRLPNAQTQVFVALILWQRSQRSRDVLKTEDHINKMRYTDRRRRIPEGRVKAVGIHIADATFHVFLAGFAPPGNHDEIAADGCVPAPLEAILWVCCVRLVAVWWLGGGIVGIQFEKLADGWW